MRSPFRCADTASVGVNTYYIEAVVLLATLSTHPAGRCYAAGGRLAAAGDVGDQLAGRLAVAPGQPPQPDPSRSATVSRRARSPASTLTALRQPGVELRANLKSISHRCQLFEVAFVWELTKETIHLPLGCLKGGFQAHTPAPDDQVPSFFSLLNHVV